jgi:hypothetical protein
MGRKLWLPAYKVGEQMVDQCFALHHQRNRLQRIRRILSLLRCHNVPRGVEENENPRANGLLAHKDHVDCSSFLAIAAQRVSPAGFDNLHW